MIPKIPFLLSCYLSFIASAAIAQNSVENSSQTGNRNNIVSLAPVLINNTGPGAGLSYERLLDSKGRFGFNASFAYAHSKAKWHYGNYYSTNCLGSLFSLKYYTAAYERPVRYALGFTIPLDILLRKTTESRSPGGHSEQNATDVYNRVGILFHNSLNFTVSKRIILSLDANLGFAGSDEKDGDSFSPYASLLFKTGYRF